MYVFLQRYSLLNPIGSPTNEEDYFFMEQTDDSQVAIAIYSTKFWLDSYIAI